MKFWARLRLAVEILRGRVKIENETVACAKEHVGAGEVRVKRNDLSALLAGNTELGVLRGAVATLETAKYAQVRATVIETVAHLHKSE